MKLTRSVSYAVSVLLNVERYGDQITMTAADISRNSQFPPRFLYRILRRLVDSRLLTGVSGPGGGYRLARPAQRITLLDVVTAVEGAQDAGQLEPASGAHWAAIDVINNVCTKTAKRFNADLKKLTLAKLAAEVRRAKPRRRPAKPKTAKTRRKADSVRLKKGS